MIHVIPPPTGYVDSLLFLPPFQLRQDALKLLPIDQALLHSEEALKAAEAMASAAISSVIQGPNRIEQHQTGSVLGNSVLLS